MMPAMAASLAVDITYVPADCGSILPGKSKAPKAFRDVGIVQKLRDAGIPSVTEHQALNSPATYSPTTFPKGGVRDEELNVHVCQRVQHTITQNLSKSANTDTTSSPPPPPPFQLILGGECSMLPGILTAHWHRSFQQPSPPLSIGLIYIDADTDLTTPSDPSSHGTFASMTMTHLTRTPGSLPSMHQFARPDGAPLCDSTNTVLFGLNMSLPSNTRAHFTHLFDHDYKVVTSTAVSRDPVAQAQKTLAFLERNNVDLIVVHLDVDAIDPGEFPLANVPNFTGVAFERMMSALRVFLACGKVVALVVAEVNPDHDPGLRMVGRLADEIVRMLAGRGKG